MCEIQVKIKQRQTKQQQDTKKIHTQFPWTFCSKYIGNSCRIIHFILKKTLFFCFSIDALNTAFLLSCNVKFGWVSISFYLWCHQHRLSNALNHNLWILSSENKTNKKKNKQKTKLSEKQMVCDLQYLLSSGRPWLAKSIKNLLMQ